MTCAQDAAHNPKSEKMGLFRHLRWWQKTLKGPPTCFNVVTTLDKPSTLTHKPHISFRSYFYEFWEHVYDNHSMGLFRQLNFGWGKAQFSVCDKRMMTKFSCRNSELFETREVSLKKRKLTNRFILLAPFLPIMFIQCHISNHLVFKTSLKNSCNQTYRQTSNIGPTLVGNKLLITQM